MPEPLHPAIVHFPLVLAVLIPFVAAAALVLALRSSTPRRPWTLALITAAGLTLSAWVAVETGEQQEERVEAVVPEAAVSRHAAAAETLLWSSAALLLIVAAGLAPGRVGGVARVAAVPTSLVLLVMAFRVGDSGGQLVYTHGAAQAYATAAPEVIQSGGIPGGEHGEREGRREREGHERR